MADPRRTSMLSFTLLLCFSLWLGPGETFWGQIEECPANYFSATYDARCTDRCDKRGEEYYWCQTNDGWDYCSPGENIDFHGKLCSSTCARNGQNTYQCYLVEGSWSTCGRVEQRAMIYYTVNQKECIDKCEYYESGDYFWCHDGNSWDYCSPLPDHTYKNEPCRLNHQCSTYGESFSWCYTTFNNDWDRCGVINPGECSFSGARRRKRQPGPSRMTCSIEEDNNRRTVTFVQSSSGDFAPTNRDLRNDALELINRWDNQGLTEQASSNLIRTPNLRIDNQGLVNRNNQRCYNLQIQINKPRGGRSTTVAQIIVPVDTSADQMRWAFRESLQNGLRVELNVANEPSTSSDNNQKTCKRRKH